MYFSGFFDTALNLELAEHAYLRSLGWTWCLIGDELAWVAPRNHKGSNSLYGSRNHAINSVKRWCLNNPKMRLIARGTEDGF